MDLTYFWVRVLLFFRKKNKAIPPTQKNEVESNAEAVLKAVDLLTYKCEDAFAEELLTDKTIIAHLSQLSFHACRIRDLIKDNQNEAK